MSDFSWPGRRYCSGFFRTSFVWFVIRRLHFDLVGNENNYRRVEVLYPRSIVSAGSSDKSLNNRFWVSVV